MTNLAVDTFVRANQTGFGTASDGVNTWSGDLMSGGHTSISSNEGVMGPPGGDGAVSCGSHSSTTDINMLVRTKTDSTSNLHGFLWRWTNASQNGYRCGLFLGTEIVVDKYTSGGRSNITSGSFSYSASTWYWIRLIHTAAGHLQIRAWADGSSEPSTWVIDTTETTYSSGDFGFSSFMASGDVYFDSLTVTDNQSASNALISTTHAKFFTEMLLEDRTRVKFYTNTSLTDRTRATFITAKSLKGTTHSNFIIANAIKTTTHGTFITAKSLITKVREKFYTRTGLVGRTRAKFSTMVSLAEAARSIFITAKRITTLVQDTFKNNAVITNQWYKLFLSSIKHFINLSFSDLHPIALKFGDSPMAQPNSTVQVSVTAMNASNQALSSLASMTCVVTFPDGTQSSTFSLGSGIVNSGGGVYTLIYTTKSPGVNNELWTATDTSGDQVQFLNKTFVTY